MELAPHSKDNSDRRSAEERRPRQGHQGPLMSSFGAPSAFHRPKRNLNYLAHVIRTRRAMTGTTRWRALAFLFCLTGVVTGVYHLSNNPPVDPSRPGVNPGKGGHKDP
jgi:hypothetical protein